jgi:hypothetical protein
MTRQSSAKPPIWASRLGKNPTFPLARLVRLDSPDVNTGRFDGGQSDDQENTKMERPILTSILILPRFGEKTGDFKGILSW